MRDVAMTVPDGRFAVLPEDAIVTTLVDGVLCKVPMSGLNVGDLVVVSAIENGVKFNGRTRTFPASMLMEITPVETVSVSP